MGAFESEISNLLTNKNMIQKIKEKLIILRIEFGFFFLGRCKKCDGEIYFWSQTRGHCKKCNAIYYFKPFI